MATVERFEELECWQAGRLLTRRIYKVSSDGRFAKDFALRDQMRRAAISVMSNIAEGFESRTRPLFIELLGRAKGSAGEVRSQLYAALDAGYLKKEEFNEIRDLAEKTSSQISRLTAYLRSAPTTDNVSEELPPFNSQTF